MMDDEEFSKRMKLIEAQKNADEIKHLFKIEELDREILKNREFHELELTRIRIKSAEIRRSKGGGYK